MQIKKISDNKEEYMELLLLGDEQESMIFRYLKRSDLYVMFDGENTVAVCAVTDEGGGVLEIKNIAVSKEYQKRGLGKRFIDYIEKEYSGRFFKLRAGTGDSPSTVGFYEKCGFKRTFTVKNFFTDNYDHPIFEDGRQLVDMIYFEKNMEEQG